LLAAGIGGLGLRGRRFALDYGRLALRSATDGQFFVAVGHASADQNGADERRRDHKRAAAAWRIVVLVVGVFLAIGWIKFAVLGLREAHLGATLLTVGILPKATNLLLRRPISVTEVRFLIGPLE